MKLGRSHLAVSTWPHVISFQLLNLLASNHGKKAYPKWKAHSWRALPLPSANHYFFSIKIMKYKWLQERGKIPELFPAGIVSSDWNGEEKTWVQQVSTCPFNGVQQKQRKKNKSKYFLHLAADTVCVCTTTHHVPITLTTYSSAHLSQKGFRSKAVVPKSMYNKIYRSLHGAKWNPCHDLLPDPWGSRGCTTGTDGTLPAQSRSADEKNSKKSAQRTLDPHSLKPACSVRTGMVFLA